MNEESAIETAFREGIGQCAIDIGFKKKSKRLYIREDDDFRAWVRLRKERDGRFVDYAGMTSKALEKTINQSGIEIGQYGFEDQAASHIFVSAIEYWAQESRWSETLARRNAHKYGALAMFIPWRRRWRHRDPYESSPFTDRRAWKALPDCQGCAAASSEKWREVVERWLETMRKPNQFARWYDSPSWAKATSPLARAAAWAWAGEAEIAKRYLQREYDKRLRTKADTRKSLTAKISNSAQRLGEHDLENMVNEAMEMNMKLSSDAASLSRFIGLNID